MWCPCILLKKCVEIYGINAILNVLYKSFNLLTDAFGSSLDYSGYRDSWEQWSHELHCRKAFLANAGATKKDWELIEHEIGACYFDIVRCHLVDPMHNHLLGTAESMMTIWMESGLQCFENIQKQAGLVNLPAGIGRIPGKIASSWLFRLYCWSGKCEQLFRLSMFSDILSKEHYLLWCTFAQAYSILCRPYLHVSHF